MPTLRNHTHCQVAQKANAQTKTCQRVWLPQHTGRQRRIKHENTTSCIVHLADSAKFEGVTSNKLCSGLTGSCFESPNGTIHVTVVRHTKTHRTNSTFGFCQRTKPTLKKPKELFFANARKYVSCERKNDQN